MRVNLSLNLVIILGICFPWSIFYKLLQCLWSHCLRFSVQTSCWFCWSVDIFVANSVRSWDFHVWYILGKLSVSYIWSALTFILILLVDAIDIFIIFLLGKSTHCLGYSALSCFFNSLVPTEECCCCWWYGFLVTVCIFRSRNCIGIRVTCNITILLLLVIIHSFRMFKIMRSSHCILLRKSSRVGWSIWRSSEILRAWACSAYVVSLEILLLSWWRDVSWGSSTAQTSACWWSQLLTLISYLICQTWISFICGASWNTTNWEFFANLHFFHRVSVVIILLELHLLLLNTIVASIRLVSRFPIKI